MSEAVTASYLASTMTSTASTSTASTLPPFSIASSGSSPHSVGSAQGSSAGAGVSLGLTSAAGSRRGSEVSDVYRSMQQQPDLSHLTLEERSIIENVIHRQQDEENKEISFLR